MQKPDATVPPTVENITTLGWISRSNAPTRSSVDLARTPTWTAARVWSTGGSLHATPLPEGTQRVFLSVDGDAIIHVDDQALELKPRHLLVVDGTSAIVTESESLWARFEFHLRSSSLPQSTFVQHFAKPLELGESHMAITKRENPPGIDQAGFEDRGGDGGI